MAQCSAMNESMPLLLTESLGGEQRELAHQHIEGCADCAAEWAAYKDAWSMLGELPEVEVPARAKERFLATVLPAAAPANVVPFRRRPALKWLAQAAAVVMLVGGSYWAGNRTAPIRIAPTGPTIESVQAAAPFSIAETRVLPASAINPNIEGRPNIENVQFVEPNAKEQIGLSFDVTSRVTVTGAPSDKSMVRLLSYVLEHENATSPSRSRAIEWVRQTYSDPKNVDPEIANALAKVLRSDTHEGVRIRAVDTLRGLGSPVSNETREALIDALKNDPNPSVRIKAVEALADLARGGATLDQHMIDTLREKAIQDDENPYVRVKAAEALSSIRP